MTPTHKQIYHRIKNQYPNARHISVCLDYTHYQTGNVGTDIWLHIDDLCKKFKNYAELVEWFSRKELLFRKFAA